MTEYEQRKPEYSTEEESKMKSLADSRYNDEPVQEHDKNFIVKVYDTLLTNMAVQNGMKTINQISQPIFNKYHELLDERISDIRHKGQEVINTTKEKLTSWLYNVNVYSHLVGLWILQNSPFSNEITSEEHFLKSFENYYNGRKKLEAEDVMQIAKTFYNIIAEAWVKLVEPSAEDIKNVLIKAVAKTIGRQLGFNDDFYAGNLIHTFKDVVEKRKQLVSDESFCDVVKKMTGHAWVDEYSMKKATHDFYTFAKRFTLIDLPLVVNTKSVSKALISFLQESSLNYSESTLNLIDEYLEKIIKYLSIEIKETREETAVVSLRGKSKILAHKVALISQIVADRSLETVTSNKLYIMADSYLHFKERFDDLMFIAAVSADTFREQLYEPSKKFIYATYDKVHEKYTVVMEGLNVQLLKDQIPKVREAYEYLKEATFVLKEKTLEIKFDKEHLITYKNEIQKNLEKLYLELKAGDLNKIKSDAYKLYEEAVSSLKARRNFREMRAIEKVKAE